MHNLQGIYCTDGIARNNTCLSISALDDMIWMGSGGRPTSMSHDIHRFVGWSNKMILSIKTEKILHHHWKQIILKMMASYIFNIVMY